MRSYMTRSCAACMSTSTRPSAVCARMYTPCSCATAKPSGVSSSCAASVRSGGDCRRGPFPHGDAALASNAAPAPARARAASRAEELAVRIDCAAARRPLGQREARLARARGTEARASPVSQSERRAARRLRVGRVSASARSSVRNMNSCTLRDSRKRTSSFCGCAFTSTSVGSISRYSTYAQKRPLNSTS